MTKMTVTEGLAELTTIGKRMDKKRTFIRTFLMRPDKLRDPLHKDGGSAALITKEFQSLKDLEQRHVNIRLAIQKVNHLTQVTVGTVTKSLAEWLTWRKEIAPGLQTHYSTLLNTINGQRQAALRSGATVVTAGQEAKPDDIVVNLDEAELSKAVEELETVLGALDGQLSLKNATVYIEV